MKVLKNYFYSAGYQLLVIIVPIITTPYVNRVLGPKGIGINTYSNTIIQYFTLFGSLGILLYGSRQIAYIRDSKYELSKQFYEIQIVHIIGMFVALLFFFIYWSFLAQYKDFMLIQSVNLVAAVFDISWFYQGLENFKVTVLKNTVVKLLCVALIFSLIHNPEDVGLYIFIYALSSLFGNLTLWTGLKKYLVKVPFKQLEPLKHLAPSISLFIPTVAVQIYQTFNKTLLGFFSGVTYAGYYFNADTIIKMLLYLVTAIGTVMLPHTSNAFASGKTDKVKSMMIFSANITTCVTVAFAFGISAISTNFAPLFFGRKFAVVGIAIMLESPVIYFAGLSSVIGAQYLIPTNQIKPYTFSLVLGAVVSLILDIILIPKLGLFGAIYATVIAEFVVLVYQTYFVVKNQQFHCHDLYQDLIKYIVSGIVMFILVKMIGHVLSNVFYNLILQVAGGTFIYGLLITLLRTKPICFIKNKLLYRK